MKRNLRFFVSCKRERKRKQIIYLIIKIKTNDVVTTEESKPIRSDV